MLSVNQHKAWIETPLPLFFNDLIFETMRSLCDQTIHNRGAINKGEGDIKTSSCPNYTKYRHLVVEIFEKLHKRFDIKVLSSSCSLTEHYFTPKQIQTITKNGKALSGDEKERVLNIIEKSTELFSQPLFSTSFFVMQRGLDFLDRSRS